MAVYVLIHSPLVGPLTWEAVADDLTTLRGREVVVPELITDPHVTPYWEQHTDAVVRAVEALPPDRALILVGHSGAGPLLPAVRQALDRPVAGYIFVDADIPRDGASRLDLFASPEEAEQVRRLAVGGMLPTWGDEQLRDAIPDDDTRRRFVAQIRPLPLAVYEEPLPVFDGWPDAPCAYLQLSGSYEPSVHHAVGRGWPYTKEIGAGHFHMLVDPPAVANALMDLAERLGVSDDP